jgi:hypothetical protein
VRSALTLGETFIRYRRDLLQNAVVAQADSLLRTALREYLCAELTEYLLELVCCTRPLGWKCDSAAAGCCSLLWFGIVIAPSETFASRNFHGGV